MLMRKKNVIENVKTSTTTTTTEKKIENVNSQENFVIKIKCTI